jgi:alpha-L-rhamnosidase
MRRHFGRMVRPGLDYSRALWEKMAPDGSSDEVTGDLPVDGNSLAHGWATSPLTALSDHVLGVTPVEPGYGEWRIAPQVGDLRWARGQVPTPYGAIKVRWSRNRRDTRLRLEVAVPEGTTGTIVPPLSWRTSRVLLDGASVPVGQPITIAGGPRTRTITVLVG